MKKLALTILQYLTYPSTWKGIVTLITTAGVVIAPEYADKIVTAGATIVGAIWTAFSDADVNTTKQ